MKKTFFLILIFAALTYNAIGQIVSLSPVFPEADGTETTLTFDATQGTAGLVGASTVYMHSGVVTTGPDGTGFEYVVGNWGQDDGIGQMTKVEGETDKWQITFTPDIRTYYKVPEGETIYRLAMVFRNADGSAEGKGSAGSFEGGTVISNGDIFLDLNAGDFVNFKEPNGDLFFLENGETLKVRAEATKLASEISIARLDEQGSLTELVSNTNTDSIVYEYTATQTDSLTLIAEANISGTVYRDTISFEVFLKSGSPIINIPSGVTSGLNYSEDPTKATLVLTAPNKEFVYIVGDFNNWQIDNNYKMNKTPDGEQFWITLNNLEPGKEYIFQYWVDGTIKIGDPYADKVADPWNDPFIPESVYPNLPAYDKQEYGIATVLQTAQEEYVWSYPEVKGGKPRKEELVIYELLIRDFLGSHSYTDLTDSLDYLASLGVNAIELMPVMEFEGNLSWGYNPSYFFAPDKFYGTKNDLKHFIDKAHEKGMVVLLDMVLNHAFGQNAMVRMYWDTENNKPAADNPWFNTDPTHPFNVGYDFNHESQYTKDFTDAVNKYWITEYNFDGYRFDLSKGFTQQNNINDVGAWSAYDASRIALLKRMADEIWSVEEDIYIILEHFADNTEEKELAEYGNGMMLWGNLTHDYGNALKGNTNANFDWILSDTRGWAQDGVVGYMESHDEERLMVKNLKEGQAEGAYNVRNMTIALDRIKLGSAFFYTVPGPKMLWQFGEMGYDFSINACPPDWTTIENSCRVDNKPIPWGDIHGLDYYNDPLRENLRKAVSDIVNLTQNYSNAFEDGDFTWTPSGKMRRINIVHDTLEVTIIGNFGTSEGTIDPSFSKAGKWYDFFGFDSLEVSDINASITLAPGEFRIYTDTAISASEQGLAGAFQPVVTVSPKSFKASDEITITFNATAADAGATNGLVGAEKVYMYAGVVTDGANSTNLGNYVGTTDQDDGVGEMTKLTGEENLWEITLTPNQYFNVGNAQFFRIGLYFRDATGENTGKGQGNSTIFLEVEPDKSIVTTDPAVFNKSNNVTIFFDAKLADPAGTSGLQGVDKVYMHSGVISSGENSTEWNNVIGNWGADDGIGLMTAVEGETDVWQITIRPEAYYGVEAGTPIYRLGMVFRNADGSAEGKGPGGTDILIPVSQDIIIGLDKEDLSQSFTIYPNPASDQVGFLLPHVKEPNLQLQLISASGKLVLSKNFSHVKGSFVCQMDTSNLADGMYIVKIFTAKTQAVKKLLIKH